jgi:hypothetical protein
MGIFADLQGWRNVSGHALPSLKGCRQLDIVLRKKVHSISGMKHRHSYKILSFGAYLSLSKTRRIAKCWILESAVLGRFQ